MTWQQYYEKNKGRPLRELYVQAMQHLPISAGDALDLGCGNGVETLDLLRRGFNVYAVDREPQAIELLREAAPNSARLHTFVSGFEEFRKWRTVDLVVSFHGLPFCRPDSFSKVLNKTLDVVREGGMFE